MKDKKNKQITSHNKAFANHRLLALCFSVLILIYSLSPSYAAHNNDGALDDPAQIPFLEQMMRENYVEAMMRMATQLTAVMMYQMEIVALFFDAKQQLETQHIFRVIEAEAHKEFHPSVEMCIIGTNVRSLAASERKYKVNAAIINELMLDRETSNQFQISSEGLFSDYKSRFTHFTNTYCDVDDLNGMLDAFPDGAFPAICVGNPPRPNNDLDFTRMYDTRMTLDVDFTDNVLTDDEEDIIALTRNLFMHTTFTEVSQKSLLQEFSGDDVQDMRSVHAMRGIIRNSWGHLIGMKTNGTQESATYLYSLINQVMDPATTPAELREYVGSNPSYFAQMEFLTKKMYQNPDFFTNLYTKPANVSRTSVALQAIELMNNRDRYEAALRKEMLVSLILESKIREHQEDINNQILLRIGEDFIDNIECSGANPCP
jgi:hypothetical protein